MLLHFDLTFSFQAPKLKFQQNSTPKAAPYTTGPNDLYNRKLKSDTALSRAENYGFHSTPLKTTPYVQSAKCQRQTAFGT